MGHFVRPEVVRLSLSGDQWIDVKKRLNAGESRRMYASQIKDATAGEKYKLDVEQVGYAQIVAHLIAWSLTDDDGKPVPYSRAALDNVDPDLYVEIRKAVDAHIEAQDTARSEEKNAPVGASA